MIFIDTGAFCAFSDRSDSFHVIAVKQFSQILKGKARLITTNFVIDETYSWIRYRLGYQPANEFLGRSRQAEEQQRLEVVTVSKSLENHACRLLAKYSDQDLSYTDATSLALIKERKISRAFTFDRHFHLFPLEVLPSISR